jgi:hypothetical protein
VESTCECGNKPSDSIKYWETIKWLLNSGLSSSAQLRKQKQTHWPESASEPNRPSDHRLSAKLVPTFVDRGVSRSQRGGSNTAVISVF